MLHVIRVNVTKHIVILSSFGAPSSCIGIRHARFTRGCFLKTNCYYIYLSERFLDCHGDVASGYAITSYTNAIIVLSR